MNRDYNNFTEFTTNITEPTAKWKEKKSWMEATEGLKLLRQTSELERLKIMIINIL